MEVAAQAITSGAFPNLFGLAGEKYYEKRNTTGEKKKAKTCVARWMLSKNKPTFIDTRKQFVMLAGGAQASLFIEVVRRLVCGELNCFKLCGIYLQVSEYRETGAVYSELN